MLTEKTSFHVKSALLTLCALCSFALLRAQDYTALRAELENIRQTDQQLRFKLDSIVRKARLEWKDPAIQALVPVVAKQDSINLTRVTTLLDKHGWMGQTAIGKVANEAIFLVIQHADSSVMLRYFPLLAMSSETGGSPREYYAMMLDRILTERGQPQVYGTQISMRQRDGRYVLFPIADREQVDQRRRSVGLPDLQSWMTTVNAVAE